MKIRSVTAAVALAAGGAFAWPALGRDVPDNLVPPAGQPLLFDAVAVGVQVYECTDAKTGLEWTFRGPEARLTDARGSAIGKHYGGPTGEAPDGSAVVGELVASAPADDSMSIPQLLMRARSRSGTGRFSTVASIQRLQTSGGKAPATACSRESLGRTFRSAYSARYFFYGDKPR